MSLTLREWAGDLLTLADVINRVEIWLKIWYYIWQVQGQCLKTTYGKLKFFAPPREHGPPHVHVRAKGFNAEVKVSLLDLSVIGRTSFSKRTVKGIILFVYKNHDLLWECWESLHGSEKKD